MCNSHNNRDDLQKLLQAIAQRSSVLEVDPSSFFRLLSSWSWCCSAGRDLLKEEDALPHSRFFVAVCSTKRSQKDVPDAELLAVGGMLRRLESLKQSHVRYGHKRRAFSGQMMNGHGNCSEK